MTFLGLRPATVASPKRDRASAGYLSLSKVFQFALLADYRVSGGDLEQDSPPSSYKAPVNPVSMMKPNRSHPRLRSWGFAPPLWHPRSAIAPVLGICHYPRFPSLLFLQPIAFRGVAWRGDSPPSSHKAQVNPVSMMRQTALTHNDVLGASPPTVASPKRDKSWC